MDRATVYRILTAIARRWWVALLVLIAVLAMDVAFTSTRQQTYLARATMVVSPSTTVERGQLVYSVDSLGRGRIIGTFAEVLASDVVQWEVASRMGLASDAARGSLTIRSSVVADTAVIQVLVESPDPVLSADAANVAGEVGIEQMTTLYPVYALTFLSRAKPPTSPYRPDPVRNYSLGLLVGLVLSAVMAYLADLMVLGMSKRPTMAVAHRVLSSGPIKAGEERAVGRQASRVVPRVVLAIVISLVVATPIWLWVADPHLEVMNQGMRALGLPASGWSADSPWAVRGNGDAPLDRDIAAP
jgi:capsular polysaccharide biosynthesis protein